jgi:hypothetical protein
VNDGPLSKNNVNYSSISRCVNEIADSRHILELGYGKICCPSVNLSMNKCQRYSGITCYPFTDSNSFTFSFSYSTFVDNNTPGYVCFFLTKEVQNMKLNVATS